MLSDALRAAAYEAEELEKRQTNQESRLDCCDNRVLVLEDENRKLRRALSKVGDSLRTVVLALEELEN